MVDDDEPVFKKPKKNIHYGSLEKSLAIQNKLDDIQSDEDDYEPDARKPATHGNVNVSNEYYELEQSV